MAPKLYMSIVSPPVRAVLMCARAINLELDFIEIDFFKEDHLKPEYVKLNPLHTFPLLDDDGFILADSHAIMAYLVDTYSKDKSLYPEDTKKRAIIDQRLHFDSSIIFARHLRIAIPVALGQVNVVGEEHVKSLNEAYEFIETYLQKSQYVAGDSLSIADFSVLTSITNSNCFAPIDEDKYPRIKSWRKLLQALPYHDEINKVGGDEYRRIVESKLSK